MQVQYVVFDGVETLAWFDTLGEAKAWKDKHIADWENDPLTIKMVINIEE